jgi:hypothetical protein
MCLQSSHARHKPGDPHKPDSRSSIFVFRRTPSFSVMTCGEMDPHSFPTVESKLGTLPRRFQCHFLDIKSSELQVQQVGTIRLVSAQHLEFCNRLVLNGNTSIMNAHKGRTARCFQRVFYCNSTAELETFARYVTGFLAPLTEVAWCRSDQ